MWVSIFFDEFSQKIVQTAAITDTIFIFLYYIFSRLKLQKMADFLVFIQFTFIVPSTDYF